MENSFFSTHQRGADTLRADTTDRWVYVSACWWFDHMLVIDGASCNGCLWFHSIPSVPLQILGLRKLRSGLHEEGMRKDHVCVSMSAYWSLFCLKQIILFSSDPNPHYHETTQASVTWTVSYGNHIPAQINCEQITAERAARQEQESPKIKSIQDGDN